MKARGSAPRQDFLPGLDRREIDGLTGSLPFRLPKDVIALYAWHNGMTPGGTVLPRLVFPSLQTAVARYAENIERNRNGRPYPDGVPTGPDGRVLDWPEALLPWGDDWFPVFESGGCDHFLRCGHIGGGELWYWCPEFGDLGWESDTLRDFLEEAAQIYETGAYYHDERYGPSIDSRKSSAIARSLDKRPADVQSLVQDLRGGDPMRRIKARGRLNSHQYPEAVRLLLPLLEDRTLGVAEDAARILARSRQPEVVASLVKAAAWWESNSSPEGNPVLYNLAGRERDLVTTLVEMLATGGDEEVRVAAARCLGALKDARAYPVLDHARSDPSPAVRAAAIDALAGLAK